MRVDEGAFQDFDLLLLYAFSHTVASSASFVFSVSSASFAAAAYLEQTKFKETGKKVYIVGEVGIQEELDLIGVPHIGAPRAQHRVPSAACPAPPAPLPPRVAVGTRAERRLSAG